MERSDDKFKAIGVDYQQRVCTITLGRDGKLSCFDQETRDDLCNLFADLKEDSDTQVVILTGRERFFCYGTFDPKSRGQVDKPTVIRMILEGNMLIDDLEKLPQITIAAVNGTARGAGVELSLACDIRYAGQSASFLQHEATMGGFPGGGGPVRLPMIVGHARAMDLICSARTISACDAKDYGLVLDVLPDDELMLRTIEQARAMARNGPLALRGAKRVSRMRQAPGWADARLLSNELRRELEFSQDVAEAIAAHKEGRSPLFKGS